MQNDPYRSYPRCMCFIADNSFVEVLCAIVKPRALHLCILSNTGPAGYLTKLTMPWVKSSVRSSRLSRDSASLASAADRTPQAIEGFDASMSAEHEPPTSAA